MSRRRYISTEISSDPKIYKLIKRGGFFAGMLYTWMIPHADDDATLPCDIEELILKVIPGLRDISVEEVESALTIMTDLGLIIWNKEREELRFPEIPYRLDDHWRLQDSEWKMLRLIVISRDGLVCGICGGEVAPDDVHIDHIQPVSRGGSNDLDNLQVTHSVCNKRKGNREL